MSLQAPIPNLPPGNCFVIEASVPTDPQAMYLNILSPNASGAHMMATGEFRKKRGLRPNIEVHTVTIAQSTEEVCDQIMKIIGENQE